MMSNAIKDLSMSFLSPIDFEVEWHNSQSRHIVTYKSLLIDTRKYKAFVLTRMLENPHNSKRLDWVTILA